MEVQIVCILGIHKSVWGRGAYCAEKIKMACHYGISSWMDMDAEVSEYRFQPLTQRPVLEDRLKVNRKTQKETNRINGTIRNCAKKRRQKLRLFVCKFVIMMSLKL